MKAIVPAWRANSLAYNWFNEFDQIFNEMFEQRQQNGMGLALDVDESEKFILFSVDLPGMKEEDIHIELKDSVLTIAGERKEEISHDTSRSFRGKKYGRFGQSFRLPKTVDQEKIEADYSEGVLKVLLPKVEAEQPKKIDLKAKKGSFLSDLLTGKKDPS